MLRLRLFVALLIAISLLVGCAPKATPTPVSTLVPTLAPTLAPTAAPTVPALATTKMTYEQALQLVRTKFPANRYMTNEFLPKEPVTGPTISGYTQVRKIKVGMPWIMNDEEAPFYNALALGYYIEEGLEVELVPGGAGIDHLKTLGGKVVDFAVVASGGGIPRAVVSITPNDVVAIGTLLKGWPYSFFTIKPELQDRKLTPSDLEGRTVAVQSPTAGGDLYLLIMLDRYGIPRNKVSVISAGSDLSVLFANKADFYSAWVNNQPRQAEENGYKWNAIRYREWINDQYADVLVARRETLQSSEGQDMTRRFLRATYRGLRYLLEHPEESADISVKYVTGVGGKLTKEQALWRFKTQADLITGSGGLMSMDPLTWDQLVSTFVQYETLQLPK